MTCRLCKKREKTWNGDDPRCAFESNKFDNDNWNCATMNKLRSIASVDYGNRTTFWSRDDIISASIGVVKILDDTLPQVGWIVMTWYKSRGKTGQAIVVKDDYEPETLQVDVAVKTAKDYEGLKN